MKSARVQRAGPRQILSLTNCPATFFDWQVDENRRISKCDDDSRRELEGNYLVAGSREEDEGGTLPSVGFGKHRTPPPKKKLNHGHCWLDEVYQRRDFPHNASWIFFLMLRGSSLCSDSAFQRLPKPMQNQTKRQPKFHKRT